MNTRTLNAILKMTRMTMGRALVVEEAEARVAPLEVQGSWDNNARDLLLTRRPMTVSNGIASGGPRVQPEQWTPCATVAASRGVQD